MSNIMKVFLLLAVIVCISKAQLDNESGQQCLCKRTRNGIDRRNSVKDVQIYQATIFCNKVEIVVTIDNGFRYCLNPKLKAVQRLMASIIKGTASTTASNTASITASTTAAPTTLTSSPGSTNTARN